MTQETKTVFSDPQLLRTRLEQYLQTPKKVELYARAAESFFAKGNNEELKFKLTWSWWAFFGQCWFFFFRKEYLFGAILFLIGVGLSLCAQFVWLHANNFVFIIMIFCAVVAKYKVIKNFEAALDRNSDEALELLGGKNNWAIWLPISISVICLVFVAFTMDFSELENM